jgi:hypothetical protein
MLLKKSGPGGAKGGAVHILMGGGQAGSGVEGAGMSFASLRRF